ncbi:MAG: outer membrane protein assembly factor BamC [Gammaproteobacteria bacterium]
MKPLNSRIVGVALLALNVSACETVKGFFPDKLNDYRYSREIPPLEIPPDLKSDTIKLEDDLHSQTAPQSVGPALSEAPAQSVSIETPATAAVPPQSVVVWSAGGRRLQINEAYEKAWLIVSKALTHKAVEITDRDRSQGVFFVEYDAEKYQVKDGTIWDELMFLFGSSESHEQPFRVRVIENDTRSEVAVTDENDAEVTEGPGLNLLELLFDTIKADAEGTFKTGDEDEKQDTENDEH